MKSAIFDDMLFLLMKSLPDDLSALRAAKNTNNFHELKRLIHKLRGALCYCDVPTLSHVAMELEIALKHHNLQDILHLFKKLEMEIENLLEKTILMNKSKT